MSPSSQPNDNNHNDDGEKIVAHPPHQYEYSTLPEVVPKSDTTASSSQPQEGFIPPSTSTQSYEQQGFVAPPIENHPLFRHPQSPPQVSSSGFVPPPTSVPNEYSQTATPYTQPGSSSSPAHLGVDDSLQQPLYSPLKPGIPPTWGAAAVPGGDSYAIAPGLPPPPPYEQSSMPNQPGIALQTGPFNNRTPARPLSPPAGSSVYSPVSPDQQGYATTFSPISPASTAVAPTPAPLHAMPNMSPPVPQNSQSPPLPVAAVGARPGQQQQQPPLPQAYPGQQPAFQPQTQPGQMPGYGPPQQQDPIAKKLRSRRKLKICVFALVGAVLFIIAVVVGVAVGILKSRPKDPPPPNRRQLLGVRWGGETDMGLIGVGGELESDVFGGSDGDSKKRRAVEKDVLAEGIGFVGVESEPGEEEDNVTGRVMSKLVSDQPVSTALRKRRWTGVPYEAKRGEEEEPILLVVRMEIESNTGNS